MGYDGYTEAANRLPQWECLNCKFRALPPRPVHCPQCGYETKTAMEHAPVIWREDIRNRVGWTPSLKALVLLAGLMLAGCGLGWQTILPPIDMKPLTSTGFYNHCADVTRAECHLFYIGQTPIKPVRHWTEPAFPFGTMRYIEWMGDYPFRSRDWFPMGVPTVKGEHCGVQWYSGIKQEGTIHRELNQLYKIPGTVLEFKPSEQHAFRLKCDLDVVPDQDNMAGY